MPSNREIAERIVGGCVDRDSVETRAEYYARTIADALDAADQRGFERAREMAAQLVAENLEEQGWRIVAAIRSIPYTAENTDLSSSPPKKDKRREAWAKTIYRAWMADPRFRDGTGPQAFFWAELAAVALAVEAEKEEGHE